MNGLSKAAVIVSIATLFAACASSLSPSPGQLALEKMGYDSLQKFSDEKTATIRVEQFSMHKKGDPSAYIGTVVTDRRHKKSGLAKAERVPEIDGPILIP